MAYDEALAERVRGLMAAAGGSVEEKKMFGGLCFMLNGQMCCGVMKDDLIVKLEPSPRAFSLYSTAKLNPDQVGRLPFYRDLVRTMATAMTKRRC